MVIYRLSRKLIVKCYKQHSYDEIRNHNDLKVSEQVNLDIDDDTDLPDRMLHPELYKKLDFDIYTEKNSVTARCNKCIW